MGLLHPPFLPSTCLAGGTSKAADGQHWRPGCPLPQRADLGVWWAWLRAQQHAADVSGELGLCFQRGLVVFLLHHNLVIWAFGGLGYELNNMQLFCQVSWVLFSMRLELVVILLHHSLVISAFGGLGFEPNSTFDLGIWWAWL